MLYIGRGSPYCYCATQSLVEKCTLMAVVSRQVYNLPEWRMLPLCALHEMDTFVGVGELLRRRLCIGQLLKAVRAVKAFNPDVIYVPMISPLTPVICGFMRDRPVVLTVHDPILHSGDRILTKELLHRMCIAQTTRVVILSQAFVRTVAAAGVPESRIDVVPHGHLGYYRAKGTTRDVKPSTSTLLFFGRLERYKGLPTLLAAFARVKSAVPGARLRIVGRGSSSLCRQLAAQMPGVELMEGWVADEEVAGYFLEADAVVLPYTDASQSGVVAIAASFGVPCIASDVGGLAEQIRHGINGLLVPACDPSQLASACISILRDRELRLRLSSGARSVAETDMSWTRVGDQLWRSCQRAIQNHHQSIR